MLLHIGFTPLHLFPLDRIVQEKLLLLNVYHYQFFTERQARKLGTFVGQERVRVKNCYASVYVYHH